MWLSGTCRAGEILAGQGHSWTLVSIQEMLKSWSAQKPHLEPTARLACVGGSAAGLDAAFSIDVKHDTLSCD